MKKSEVLNQTIEFECKNGVKTYYFKGFYSKDEAYNALLNKWSRYASKGYIEWMLDGNWVETFE